MTTAPQSFIKRQVTFTPLPHMQEFLDELAALNRHPKYIGNVKNALAYFAEFLRGEGLLHPTEITRIHVIRFQSWLNEQDRWQDSYKQRIMVRVGVWIRWCDRLDYIENSPWTQIRVGSSPKKPKPLEDGDLIQLFQTHRMGAFTMSPFAFHRREMILCLLYAWGLRVHELEALNVANMDTNLDYVRCRNKGGNSKDLPYTPEIKRVFMRWIANRSRHAVPGEDALIITNTGRRMPANKISDMIADLGERGGVKVNAHRLRDTCGTNLLDSDVPVERVMKILGHTDQKQTLAYSRVNDHKVKESLEAAMDPRLSLLFKTTRTLKDDNDDHT